MPPKRALSAFFLYRQEVYDRVKAENPTAKITEITKIISDMWAHVDPATKERLEQDYQRNKIEAAKQKEEYESQYGKIERKKKKKHEKAKNHDDEWFHFLIFA